MFLDDDATRAPGQGARHQPAPLGRPQSPLNPEEGRRATAEEPSMAYMVHGLRTPIQAVPGCATLPREGPVAQTTSRHATGD